MVKLTLHVLEEPLPDDTKVVVSFHADSRPVLTGGGRATLLCGSCGFVVARRVAPETIGAVALQCPRCCRYNAVRTT